MMIAFLALISLIAVLYAVSILRASKNREQMECPSCDSYGAHPERK